MALFRRRKSVAPERTKSLEIHDDVLDTFHNNSQSPFASAYGLMYRRQPAVRTVVDFLSRNIAQLNIKTYLRVDDTDRVEVNDHPLARLLRNPNPTTSRFRFMRDTVADKAIYDLAYWRKIGYPNVTGLLRLAPPGVLRRGIEGKLTYWDLYGKQIPREELVVFSGYSPEGRWWDHDGVSPMETLRRVLEEDREAVEHRRHFWKNSARRDGVIERPLEAPEWSDTARSRFRTDWENGFSGATNAGRAPVLEEGMHWVADSFSPQEAEYVQGRQLLFEEVCRAFLMAPNLFGLGNAPRGNIEQYHTQLYQDVLGPWLRDLQDEIELQLLPDVDHSTVAPRLYVEFNLADKLKGSFEEMARTLVTATGGPIVTREEARARMNLPNLGNPQYNDLIVPLNVITGGQPAPTIPTEVPQPKKTYGRKSAKEIPATVRARRETAAKAHTELLRRYFRAQEKAVRTKAAFDMERWDAKLTGELYAARTSLARTTGKLAAKQLGGVYDENQTLHFLQATALREAENINAQTTKALEDGNVDDVFNEATGSRAERLGMATATAVINWARTETARQSQAADGKARTKTWVVTSTKSRHPEMDGETVALDDAFSNGASWPGDSAAGADEVAGCQCLVDLN